MPRCSMFSSTSIGSARGEADAGRPLGRHLDRWLLVACLAGPACDLAATEGDAVGASTDASLDAGDASSTQPPTGEHPTTTEGDPPDSGQGEDPPDDGGPATAPSPADAGADDDGLPPAQECGLVPRRLIFLGDSIFGCSRVGGKTSDTCGPKVLHAALDERFPGLSYENHAVPGAVTHDLLDQMNDIDAELPGHALVVLMAGGNDLKSLLFEPGDAAAEQYEALRPSLVDDWTEVLAWLEEPGRFTDGVSVVLNTQYDILDDCGAFPFVFYSEEKRAILADYNALLADLAAAEGRVLADHYPPFLGHGQQYLNQDCPWYVPGASRWLLDHIHPDVEGHAQMASIIDGVTPALFHACALP